MGIQRRGPSFLLHRVSTIRHSFAVHMLENGAEVKTVQELLGHTDVASTMLYTQIAHMGTKDEYMKTHPRADEL